MKCHLPRVDNARCAKGQLVVALSNGQAVVAPLRWYPRLQNATPAQRADWELAGAGYGIHWPQIDEDLSVKGLLMGWAAPGVVK